MEYKNIKIITYVLFILLIGCKDKAKQLQEYMGNHQKQKIEKDVKLLSEDSAYIKESILITSKEENLKDKQYAILLNIASHLIKEEHSLIQKNDGLNCGKPIVICVIQKDDYRGSNFFYIYWSNMAQMKTPTRITKLQDRYVLFQLQGENPLPRKALPEILYTDCSEDEIVFIINELSWGVLMCKNSTQHIAVKSIVSIEDCIEYFNDFSCE